MSGKRSGTITKWAKQTRDLARASIIAMVLAVVVLTYPARADDALHALALKRCDACHTPAGRLYEEWKPLVYGQPREYVRKMLGQFKAGTRPGPEMYAELSAYRDEDLDLLADLVSRRAPVELKQDTEPNLILVGADIYKGKCAYCHPDEGRGSEFDSAILAGQPLGYLRRQFAAILENRRPVLFMMQDNYEGLNEDDFEALAQFFASRTPARPAARMKALQ